MMFLLKTFEIKYLISKIFQRSSTIHPYLHMTERKTLSICDIKLNQSAKIKKLLTTGTKRKRLMDLGFTKDEKVKFLLKSPSGDPAAYLVRGAVIALRKSDAEKILI